MYIPVKLKTLDSGSEPGMTHSRIGRSGIYSPTCKGESVCSPCRNDERIVRAGFIPALVV